jgi:hypothetical protein
MTGLSVIPSFTGPGIGVRSWSTPKFGWGAEVMPSWAFDDIYARLRLMFTLSTGEKTRWYGLLTGGYTAINESYDFFGISYDYSVSMPTFALGIGWEKLVGFKKNKGLAFEVGYQIGQADYEITVGGLYGGGNTTIKDTFKVSPIYIGGSYTFYFNK